MEDLGSAITAQRTLNENGAVGIRISVSFVLKEAFKQIDDYQTDSASCNLMKNYFDFEANGNSVRALNQLNLEKVCDPTHHYDGANGNHEQQDMLKDQSKTLLVRNISNEVGCNELFKLFGMYGNVMKIKIFYNDREKALVEYQEASQAEIAKAHLNNCPLRGTNIHVSISKNSIIFPTHPVKGDKKFFADYAQSKEHRYKITGSKNFRNIAAPSKVLHLSNLNELKEDGFYIDLFKTCGAVKNFMQLDREKRNLLIEMKTVWEAVEGLVRFHNMNIEGRYLKVSFSKYVDIKDKRFLKY